MRFTRLIPALAVPLLLIACAQDDPTAPDPPQLSAQATGAPTEVPLYYEWFDIPNACTGEPHDIVAEGTMWVQPHNNDQTVLRVRLWVTTTSGFEGRRWETHVRLFGQPGLFNGTYHDVLVHPSGARMRWLFKYLFDISDGTFRVYKYESHCVRQ
jgi:hypothetical protein